MEWPASISKLSHGRNKFFRGVQIFQKNLFRRETNLRGVQIKRDTPPKLTERPIKLVCDDQYSKFRTRSQKPLSYIKDT